MKSDTLYLEEMYGQYLREPALVPPSLQTYFATLPPVGVPLAQSTDMEHERKQVKVLQLINAYRFLGHFHAKTNPLDENTPAFVKELTLAYHSLSETDLDTTFNTGSLVAADQLTLREIIAQLEATYCGSIGVQYMHTTSTEQKRWVQQRLESVRSTPTFSPAEKLEILDRLTAAEGLERYLHTNYVGQKRFSLEGGESLIPMLNTLIQHGGSLGAQEMVIGMAHRGRLNVLVNVLGKAPALLFGEFEGKYANNGDRTGDVKYHMGFASDMMTPGGPLHVAMAFNPSHLEIVGPVVQGAVRARQDRWDDAGGDKIIPVVLHGDAAIAKMVDSPVFHVNGDDPEAVVLITQIAFDFRAKFDKDVVSAESTPG